MKLNIVDLFSGIGGFSLGLHNADKRFKTIAFAENDPFCQKVLKKNFGNTRIFNDIREVSIDQPVFLVCGGFPCQPFSTAGKRKGTEDNRYLFPEMLDVIKQTKPRWFIGENVQGIVNMSEGQILQRIHNDLESIGYEVQSFIIPANSQGAWHKRNRVWIIASNSNELGTQVSTQRQLTSIELLGSESKENWWQTQSKLRGVPDGISYGLDKDRARRIKALGNAIVPQIIETIGKAIIKSEEDNNTL